MRIGTSSAFVEFEIEDDGSEFDHSFSIRVFRSGFSGFAQSVYIGKTDATKFISQLRQLEENDREHADLINFSTESEASPLNFTIRRADELGHVIVEATTRKHVMNVGEHDFLSVSISFELDREFLTSTIRDFERLFLR